MNQNIQRSSLAVSLSLPLEEQLQSIVSHTGKIQWVEIRGDQHTEKVLQDNMGSIQAFHRIFAIRSTAEGGQFNGSAAERKSRLLQAAPDFDLIELEGERDLQADILAAIPPHKRMIVWHGESASQEELQRRFDRYSQYPARYYKLIPHAERAGDELAALLFLHQLQRKDVIAYASGPIGLWTQIVAAHWGAPIVYSKANHLSGPSDRLTIGQLIEDYDLPNLHAFEKIYGIAGNPVFTSLSPRLHNKTYRQLGMKALYLPFHLESYADFWEGLINFQHEASQLFNFSGFTVVSPFKEAGVQRADYSQNPIIEKTGAANVVIKNGYHWGSDTTDFHGITRILELLHLSPKGLKVAIIGCGGAGRTMAAGLKMAGAKVQLVNRSEGRAQFASSMLELPHEALDGFSPKGYDLLINATPLGKKSNELPFDPADMHPKAIVVDMAYGKKKTALIRRAERLGRRAISGIDILVIQVKQQFKLMTEREMPTALAYQLADGQNSSSFATYLYQHEQQNNEQYAIQQEG